MPSPMLYSSPDINDDSLLPEVDTDTPDRGELEREAFAEINGKEKPASKDQPSEDEEEMSGENSDEAKDTDDPADEEGFSEDDLEQSLDDENSKEDEEKGEADEDDGGDEDDGSLADKVLEEEDAKEELSETEILKGRVKENQKAFTQSQQKVSELSRELAAKDEILRRMNERLDALEMGREIDSLDPLADLSPATRELLDSIADDAEGKELRAALLKAKISEKQLERKDPKPSEKPAEERSSTEETSDNDDQGAEEGDKPESELVSNYERVVTAAYPNFDESVKSKEYAEFRDSRQKTINSLIRGLDNFDPVGAIRVMKAFEKWKSEKKSSSKASSSIGADQLPKGKRSTAPPKEKRADSHADRKALEREAFAEISRK